MPALTPIALVGSKRVRQMPHEGYSAKHDDSHATSQTYFPVELASADRRVR